MTNSLWFCWSVCVLSWGHAKNTYQTTGIEYDAEWTTSCLHLPQFPRRPFCILFHIVWSSLGPSCYPSNVNVGVKVWIWFMPWVKILTILIWIKWRLVPTLHICYYEIKMNENSILMLILGVIQLIMTFQTCLFRPFEKFSTHISSIEVQNTCNFSSLRSVYIFLYII